jgi:hypothetical protein
VATEKAKEGESEWIRAGWVYPLYISLRPKQPVQFCIRIASNGGRGVYAGRSRGTVKLLMAPSASTVKITTFPERSNGKKTDNVRQLTARF